MIGYSTLSQEAASGLVDLDEKATLNFNTPDWYADTKMQSTGNFDNLEYWMHNCFVLNN